MKQRGHAVVLGGSIAGIVAAQVLSRHFQRVTIVERDALGAPRRGVPQATQAHGLLFTGVAALERLFPGWTHDVVARGGLQVDHREGVWVHAGIAQARVLPPSDGLMASRTLIEHSLREHLLEHRDNVSLLDHVSVESLCWSADQRRVLGVRTRSLSEHSTLERAADLVVDCTGRRSQLPTWLEAAGRLRVPEERVRGDIHYTTFVAEPLGKGPSDAFAILAMAPPNPRSGVMLGLEGGRFIVTLMGMLGVRPPTDEAGFRAYARQLPSPILAQHLDQLRLVGEAAPFSYPASRRLRYERVRNFPAGILMLGDSLTSFNPIFGQGMTVAALQGLCLNACLERPHRDLARCYLTRAQRIVEAPWSLAVNSDLCFPEIEGKRPAGFKLTHAYLARIYRAGAEDPVVASTLLEVINLARKQTALLKPAFLARVLLSSLPIRTQPLALGRIGQRWPE